MQVVEHEVLDAVDELLPYLRDTAPEAERLRRIPEESAKRLKETGVIRLLQPKRYAGFESDPEVFYEAVLRVAAACPSTGWVTGVLGVHPWELALFEDEVQQQVWGEDPDTWISSSYMPTGVARATEGGWIVNGRWNFSSGCELCEWVFLGVLVMGDDGQVADVANVIIPRADYAIDDVWHVMGLCGTGSNDIVVEDAFVPANRLLSSVSLVSLNAPGHAVNTSPLYKLPFGAVFASVISTAVVGIAHGLLDAHVEYQKSRVSPVGGPFTEDPYMLLRLGEATADIHGARDQLLWHVREMYELVMRGEEIPMDLRYRTRRDQTIASQRAVRGGDVLFENSGGRALSLRSPLQRYWRDMHAGRQHAANSGDKVMQAFANQLVGGEFTDHMF